MVTDCTITFAAGGIGVAAILTCTEDCANNVVGLIQTDACGVLSPVHVLVKGVKKRSFSPMVVVATFNIT